MTEIERGIWIGGLTDSSNLEWLASNKIGTVINCGGPIARPQWAGGRGPVYFEIAADDSITYPIIARHYLFFHDKMVEAESNSHNILISCYAGINRSATLLLSYLLHKLARRRIFPSPYDFVSHYRKRRPVIQNPEFFRQLAAFSEKMRETYTSI